MIKTLETTDFDELTAAQEDWEVCHRPVRAEKFEGHLLVAGVGNIQIDLERWSTALEFTGTSPHQGLSFVLPLHDCGSYMSEGLDVTADRVDVFAPGCEIHAVIKQPSSLIACSLPTGDLDARIDSPSATLLVEHATEHRVVRSTRQATDELRRWWLKLLGLSARSSMPEGAHDRLFDETLSAIARALRPGEEEFISRPRHRYRLARRARDYMLERQSNPPTIAKVCAFLNTSERSLHYAFTETYGVSPKHFLKARRLFAVHQALKSVGDRGRVSELATSLGFWDLGYFAKDYRAMFGELPSATLNRRCE